MKVTFYGRLKLTLARALPMYDIITVVADEEPHEPISRWHQVSWLGMSLNFDVSSGGRRPARFIDLRHPIESVKSFLR